MKTIIWLSFAVMAGLWTFIIMLLVRLSDWLLSALAGVSLPSQIPPLPSLSQLQQLPQLAPLQQSLPVPDWAGAWVDSTWLVPLQQGLIDMAQLVNTALPMAGGLAAVIGVVAWTFWGLVLAALLAIAIGLHWFVGRQHSAPAA